MLTIFTPTYNREKELKKIYESLKQQTNQNFIWLIVDDGSTDHTTEVIQSMIDQKEMTIEYIKQENQGKHMAYNVACHRCQTDYMICLDSDDTFTKDAVSTLLKLATKLSKETWAIVGPRVHQDGTVSSEWKVPNNQKIKMQEIYQKYQYVGETYLLLHTSITKNYLFPKFEQEKLVPENVIYDLLDNDYDILSTDEKIYISDYQEDGYTKNELKTFMNSIKGTCYSNLIKASCKSANIVYQMKAYARFRAIVSVFDIYDDMFQNIKVKYHVKVLSLLFYPIFKRRYHFKKQSYQEM